jgi:hypothetical protein
MSLGPGPQVRHAVPPQWGASSVDRQDGIFPEERCRIARVQAFIELCTPGEGP